MNFNSVIAANSSTPVPADAKVSSQLGQKDFLRLLTAQMQTQDPFDPVDNKEMLAQMAQFSSLAGLSEINDTLKLINAKLAGDDVAAPTT
jgi:flagellar basal-body rod modification protein FlgD